MEHLWSPAGATDGNRWQMERPRKRLKQAKTVAVGCDRLPQPFHGKEGVDGSSPSEGLFGITKPLQKPAFLLPWWTLRTTSLIGRGSGVGGSRGRDQTLEVASPNGLQVNAAQAASSGDRSWG
jgi:hypothetical protein